MSLPADLPATPAEALPEAGHVTNDTIAQQLDHRTIRAYTDQQVPEDVMATLLDVGRHAPTSGFYQQLTIIRIKDPKIREVIYQASGQPYVGGDRGELLIFVADVSRNARIREAADLTLKPLQATINLVQSFEDVLLAAQNIAVAAESLGLGTCYLGSIGGNYPAVIEALKLPKYTFPLLGMLIGYPDQEPQKKPRLPRSVTTSVDTYPDYQSAEYREAMSEYDQTIQTYYDLRESGRRQDSFTHQICTKPGNGPTEKSDLLALLREQGLALH